MSNDDWETPKELYDELDAEFNFNDDPCPIGGTGGLERDWGTSTFINPPYSKPGLWVKKAYEEAMKGKTVVALLKCDPSTNYFHKYILHKSEIRFIKGRLKYKNPHTNIPKNKWVTASFPSMLVIWRGVK